MLTFATALITISHSANCKTLAPAGFPGGKCLKKPVDTRHCLFALELDVAMTIVMAQRVRGALASALGLIWRAVN